jgi:peptidoglycan/LPS O-acetylase OafA/YrhL
MKASTSTLLDVLRITSAFIVFVSHCAQHWSDRVSGVIQPFAHHAVVVFFVLSGYVIAFATLGRGQTGVIDYAVARISRLYSVVIPALVLTGVLQIVGTIAAPEVYEGASRGADSLRYVMSLFFMQSVWFFSAAPATNGPLWSLSYEAWYYLAFGVVIFSKGRFWKIVMLGLVCLIAGPNIILLAPVWLGGLQFSY